MSIRLAEFVSANPLMGAEGWRQELVAGAVVTLPPPEERRASRILCLASAVACCVRRSKQKAGITMGSGLGMESPEGDHFRIADVIVSLPGRDGRRMKMAAVFQVVSELDHLSPEEEGRRAVFQDCGLIREILFYGVDQPGCRHFRLFPEGWSENRYYGMAAPVRLACLSASMFMSEVYPDHPDAYYDKEE